MGFSSLAGTVDLILVPPLELVRRHSTSVCCHAIHSKTAWKMEVFCLHARRTPLVHFSFCQHDQASCEHAELQVVDIHHVHPVFVACAASDADIMVTCVISIWMLQLFDPCCRWALLVSAHQHHSICGTCPQPSIWMPSIFHAY